jgi:cephalosporin-C deacetylase-like acetyl esterase
MNSLKADIMRSQQMPKHNSRTTWGAALVVWFGWCAAQQCVGAAPPSSSAFLEFVRGRAEALRAGDKPPANLDEWGERKRQLRQHLEEVWGGFPAETFPLDAQILGTLVRDGYRVEKVVFQTRLGVRMTANAYVPDKPGKLPALLQVHGHWTGAKQDPVVQARCIGAAKLGFFVLAVDAFGAGERAVGKALGEYHGAFTGATLLPVGLPLSGLQVYENARAVDYLKSRPEVDGARIGITGASGGGNQSMYAAAWDERLKAVVPVCSVGNYESYLGAACCMCELVPGAIRFTDEWALLGMVAPRALMVVNATQDVPQFSVAKAKQSITLAEPVFALFHKPTSLKHAIFESKHDYNHAMREAMYGWMTLHLKEEGDGAPLPEPEIRTEDPESLRCYPGASRPDDWLTIPRFAAAEGRKLLASRKAPQNSVEWKKSSAQAHDVLVNQVFGGFPQVAPVAPRVEALGDGSAKLVHFQSEPGIDLSARVEAGMRSNAPLVILIDLDGGEKAASDPLALEIRNSGRGLVTLDLRATGKLSCSGDAIGKVPDHNSAEWALWIGRPLLGQWVFDVRRLLDALERVEGTLPSEVVLVGNGPGGLVALSAGAIDRRITRVVAVGSLASFLTEVPFEGQRLGVLAPGIVRAVGDVPQLAALIAPRPLVIAGGVAGNGQPLSVDQIRAAYREAASVWKLLNAEDGLSLRGMTSPAELLRLFP